MEPGQWFGPYRVLGLLGQGGMGSVYRAQDAARREVALKVVRGRLDSQRRARFRREGELTSQLDHPGVVRVLGGGEMAGVPYLVYELIENARELDVAFRESPLRRRIELIQEAAEAVGFAHQAGIVHRDLKPANILLDEAGRVRVADFGLGKAETSDRLTRTGAFVGTPGYMAPEQITGEDTGPPADVWALGVILYEALCGRPPFEAGTWVELHARVVAGTPDWPGDVDPEAPSALGTVALKALAKDPNARYPHAASLAQELESWLRDETPEVVQEARARRRRQLGGVGALLALSLLGVASVYRGPSPTPAPSTLASSSSLAEPVPAEPIPVDSAQEEAGRAWERIAGGGDADRQLPRAWTWLQANLEHPRADEARDLLRRHAATRPLLQVEHPPRGNNARLAWLDDRTLLSHAVGLRRWRPFESRPAAGEWSTPGFVHTFARLPNGELVFEWANRLERRSDLEAEPSWRAVVEGVRFLQLSPRGDLLACASNSGPVHLLNLDDGSLVRSLQESEPRRLRGLVFGKQGDRLYLVRSTERGVVSDASLIVLATDSGATVGTRLVPPILDQALDLNPRGDRLVLGTYGGEVLLLNAETLEQESALIDPDETTRAVVNRGAHGGWVEAVAFHPDGRRLVTAASQGLLASQGSLKVWDLAREERIGPSRALAQPPWTLEFSPDGRLVALGLQEGLVEVWILDVP